MSNPNNALRRERLDAVLALAAPHVPAERRPLIEGFAREYFRQVDVDDLAERAPEDLSGALLSHWQFGAQRAPGTPEGARAQPDAWPRTAGPRAIGDRDRQRRHAVPGGLGDDGDQPPGPDAAPDRASDLRGRARCQRPAASIAPARAKRPTPPRESWMHIEVDRLVDAAAARRRWWPASSACWPTCARRSTTGSRCWRACTRRSPNSTPRRRPAAGRGGRKPRLPAMAGRRPPHPARLSPARPGRARAARTRCALVPGSGLGVLREARGRARSSASFAALPPAARALARAPSPVLVVTKANTRSTVHRAGLHRLHRRQALRRARRGDRRAPLHRPVHVHRLQRARVARRRCCAARSRRSPQRAGLPPGGHLAKALRAHAGDLPARRPVPDRRRRAVRHRAGHPGAGRAPAAAPVRLARPVRPLRLLPGVRAAREPTRPTCG